MHVDGVGAGEPVAHVVLGAHDVRDFGEHFRLVVADPQQFGQGEVGERGIGGELDELLAADVAAAELIREPLALRLGADVAPDEGGAQDLAVFVEHDGAVHLAGEADGVDGCG